MTNIRHHYSITIEKFKPSKSVIKSWLKVETERSESHAGTERFARCDCMFDYDTWSPFAGGGGGAQESKDLPRLVREKLREWLKARPEQNDEGEFIKKPSITRTTLYFRSDFPDIVNKDDVFRILAELKGATRDKTGGLWK